MTNSKILELTSFDVEIGNTTRKYFYKDVATTSTLDNRFTIHFNGKLKSITMTNKEQYENIVIGKSKYDIYESQISKSESIIVGLSEVNETIIDTNKALVKELKLMTKNNNEANKLMSSLSDNTRVQIEGLYESMKLENKETIESLMISIGKGLDDKLDIIDKGLSTSTKKLSKKVNEHSDKINSIDIESLNSTIHKLNRVSEIFNDLL